MTQQNKPNVRDDQKSDQHKNSDPRKIIESDPFKKDQDKPGRIDPIKNPNPSESKNQSGHQADQRK